MEGWGGVRVDDDGGDGGGRESSTCRVDERGFGRFLSIEERESVVLLDFGFIIRVGDGRKGIYLFT